MVAIGYLRKSRVTSDRHLSWDVQESEIRALAARHGDADFELLSDWGRSGRGDKTRLRIGFRRLREMIQAGSVTVVYSYSLSRLARSLPEYAALAELCRDKGVKIRLCKEGEFDYTSASGRLIVNVLALFAQFEAELAQERAQDAIKIRRHRGDYLGVAPYGLRVVDAQLAPNPDESPEVVLDAYRRTGSYHGAAKALNEAAFPSRHGKKWSERTVRALVRRLEPSGASPTGDRHNGRHAYLFAGLLRCSCGQTLTPRRDQRRQGVYVSYLCWRARFDRAHPRPLMVAEAQIRPWLEEEAARLRLPDAVLVDGSAAEPGRGEELRTRRRRVLDNYEDGHIERDERDRKLEAIDAELERMDATERVLEVPALDWTAAPETVNSVLRALWDHVQLDLDMRPVSAAWRLPAEYVA